ncbi:MAG: DUF6398 domain-containing protein, partial [Actinomycetota bacterium]|nr:DUF6398 domain-containing protein [Actinomycetota bacterium]
MSKRNKRSRGAARPKKRASARRGPQRRREPDLVERIADALDADDPLELLELASTLLDVVDRRSDDPFRPDPDRPTREQLLESLFTAPLSETSALLAAVAALSGDDVLRRRVSREIAGRNHALPVWLAEVSKAVAEPEAVEVTHALGDGDDVLVSVTLPGGHPLTAVVFIDHNSGSIVKDAFVVPGPLDEIVATVRAARASDSDLADSPLSPADAKVRIIEAVERGARTFPPAETETWPASRPLVEWMTSLLPDGGTGYERPGWPDDAVDDLARRFRASPFAAGVDDPDDLLSSLLWFGTGYGPGDPMRWSPTAVEILLLDWIPRKIVADVEHLTRAPDLLRAFIRFCHHERGIRPGLTEETVTAVDEFEPEYQQLIRSDRLQGPEALLAAMGVYDPEDAEDDASEDDVEAVEAVVAEIMLETLSDAVGGEDALAGLGTDPLPDEPFAWDLVAPDVHARVGEVLDLVERCCTELLDDEYRTACRRLLADVAAGDPEIFRRRGRAQTAAAAVCW